VSTVRYTCTLVIHDKDHGPYNSTTVFRPPAVPMPITAATTGSGSDGARSHSQSQLYRALETVRLNAREAPQSGERVGKRIYPASLIIQDVYFTEPVEKGDLASLSPSPRLPLPATS
jgi:hypothetical protein